MSDYSQYVAIKKASVAQTANANTSKLKTRAGYRFDGYFPLFRGPSFPANALISNKFTSTGGGAMAVATFRPSDLATPSLMWYDGAVVSSIITSGTRVTGWVDQSGNGYNLAVTTELATSPATVGTRNGMNTVNCSSAVLGTGSNNGIIFTGINVAFPRFFSSFIVFNTTNHVFFSQYESGYKIYFYTSNSPLLEVPGGQNVWDGVSPNTTAISLANDWKFMTFEYNGTTGGSGAPFSIDGTQRTTYGNPNTNATNTAPFYLNGRLGGTITGMNIAEAIFYDTVLSLADSQKIEGYLAWKWGLEEKLPAGHPYRAARPPKP